MDTHVVILTAGARPGQAPPAPGTIQLASSQPAMHEALTNLRLIGVLTENDPAANLRVGLILTTLAKTFWQAGWAEAATGHKIRSAWVVDGETRATEFAEFVTRQVDPAFTVRTSDALDEMLRAGQVVDAEIIDEPAPGAAQCGLCLHTEPHRQLADDGTADVSGCPACPGGICKEPEPPW